MDENDDVLTEIIPFIQDLIPGIPAALVLFLTKVAFLFLSATCLLLLSLVLLFILKEEFQRKDI